MNNNKIIKKIYREGGRELTVGEGRLGGRGRHGGRGRAGGPYWQPVVGGVMVNMATVSRRTGDGRPVRRTVAMRAPGFGGGRLYCSHAPSHRR